MKDNSKKSQEGIVSEFFNKWGIQFLTDRIGGSSEKKTDGKIEEKIATNSDAVKLNPEQTSNSQNNVVEPILDNKQISLQEQKDNKKPIVEEPLVVSAIMATKEEVEEKKDNLNQEQETLVQQISQTVENDFATDKPKIEEQNISNIFKKNEKLINLLSNREISEYPDYLKIDDRFVSYFTFFSTNKEINIDLIKKFDEDSNIGEFISHSYYDPINQITSRKKLEKQLRWQESSFAIQTKKTWKADIETQMAIIELNGLIRYLATQEVRMYKMYQFIRITWITEKEIKDKLEYIKILLKTMNLTCIQNKHLQAEIHAIFWTTSNLNYFELLKKSKKIKGIMSTQNELAWLRYYFNNEGNIEGKAPLWVNHFLYKTDYCTTWILLWEDLFTWQILNRDLWWGENYNTIVTWTSGTGKSYTTKLVCLREYVKGVKQIIIDPEDEYGRITGVVWGKIITVWLDDSNENKINPFDFIFPRQLVEKIWINNIDVEISKSNTILNEMVNKFNIFVSSIKKLLDIILTNEKLNDEYFKELSSILNDFFIEKWWIDRGNVISFFKYSSKPLNFRDFYEYLSVLYERETNPVQKKLLQDIQKWLYDYGHVNGTFFNAYGKWKTSVDLSSDWVVFNIKWINPPLKYAIIYSIMDYVDNIFQVKNTQPVRITLEEATVLISDNYELASYIAELYKRARKYNIWVTLVVQGIDMLFTEFKWKVGVNFGKLYIGNSEVMIILSQKLAWIESIKQNIGLSETHINFLQTLSKKNAKRWIALLLSWGNADQIRVLSEEYIHKYITTDPKEINAQNNLTNNL